MRLIYDHNIGSVIARALAADRHDVVRAVHVTPRAEDTVVLDYAVADDRILVTCDSDFGEQVFLRRAAPTPAIIYIRFEPEDVDDIVPRLLAVLDFDLLQHHMTAIGDRRDRRTPFPARSNDNA